MYAPIGGAVGGAGMGAGGAGMHGGMHGGGGVAMHGGQFQANGGMGSGGMAGGHIHNGVGAGTVNGMTYTGPFLTTSNTMATGILPGVMRPSGALMSDGAGTCSCSGCGQVGCAGGCASCMGCGGEVTSAGAQMAFVGDGRGDYITSTTYKYVGNGGGNLSLVSQEKRSCWPCLLGVLGLILLVGVALLCLQTSTTTIKSTGVTGLPKTCQFWGDPHLVTFDGARPSFYGGGEYWIVKNDAVKIQGRYEGTKYTLGLAATQKVAVGGSFIGDNIIEVEPMEEAYGGRILVNGQQVLKEFGTTTVGGATIVFDGIGVLVDQAASQWKKNIVHISLPMGIHMEVFRWGNYIDMTINMRPLAGGQDGSCGNFNNDPKDDTTQAIFDRIGARIAPGELLMRNRATMAISPQQVKMLQEQCAEGSSLRLEANQKCAADLFQGATEVQVEACAFDYCFGMNEHALSTAKTYITSEERKKLGME